MLNYSITKVRCNGFVTGLAIAIPTTEKLTLKAGSLKGLDVYSAENHNVGSVEDFLIDDSDQLQYIVVKSHGQQKTLLPISRCTDMPEERRIYTPTLNREEFKALPRYDDSQLGSGQALQMYQTNPVGRSLPVRSNSSRSENGCSKRIYCRSASSANG